MYRPETECGGGKCAQLPHARFEVDRVQTQKHRRWFHLSSPPPLPLPVCLRLQGQVIKVEAEVNYARHFPTASAGRGVEGETRG